MSISGAKDAPFIGSEERTSDKLYYRQRYNRMGKMQIQRKVPFQIQQGKAVYQVMQAEYAPDSASLEYARKDVRGRKDAGKPDWNRERERLKEQLQPVIKEMIKKQLKEEREYYKSRPSQAAKHYEEVLGAGLGNILIPAVSKQVLSQMENRMRREWLRKGR